MKTILKIILVALLAHPTILIGQTVPLFFDKVPLNEILIALNEKYDLQVSVDANLSRTCLVTLNKEVKSVEKALELIAAQCNFSLTNVNNVYSLRSKNSISKQPKEGGNSKLAVNRIFQGTVLDFDTKEPIPFANFLIGDKPLISDQNGRFSFSSKNKNEFIFIRSLNYMDTDTLLSYGSKHEVYIKQDTQELSEVLVTANNAKRVSNMGSTSGQIQFNEVKNQLVPGQSNNLLFNQLRLYPGILATGEPSTDFVIWGSYPGQNQILFDGITIFSNWGINNDIGRINSNMIKNITVNKGGYNVFHGDRVGGVIQVEGKQGDVYKIKGNLHLTNQLSSFYFSVPSKNKRTILQLAARKSYNDILNITSEAQQRNEIIIPTYNFQDYNLKLAHTFKNNDKLNFNFLISLDELVTKTRAARQGRRNQPNNLNNVVVDALNSSLQLGGSLIYEKAWKKGGISTAMVTLSHYIPKQEIDLVFSRPNRNPGQNNVFESSRNIWTNTIQERKIQINHRFPSVGKHQVVVEVAHIETQANIDFRAANFKLRSNSSIDTLQRFSFFVFDNFQLHKKVELELGLKADLLATTKSSYLQPRVNLAYQMSKNFNFHGAIGLYNQYLSLNSLNDEYGSSTEVWLINDGVRNDLLQSVHYVLGGGYIGKTFDINVEGYYKDISGISRFSLRRNDFAQRSTGSGQTVGIDLFVRKEFGSHDLFLSYTWSENIENFPLENGEERSIFAPQYQPHEIKGAAIFSFDRVKFTAAQVYGSGLKNSLRNLSNIQVLPYWRTDISAQYHIDLNWVDFDLGFSILNLFNVENAKLNQSVDTPGGARIETTAIPFTPTIFFHYGF